MRHLYKAVIISVLSLLLGCSWAWAAIDIKDEGVHQVYANIINFTGAGVTCVGSGITATCTITSGGGSGTMTTLAEGGVQVGGSDIVTLDFGSGFDLTESPDTEINVAFDTSELGATSWTGAMTNNVTSSNNAYTLSTEADAGGGNSIFNFQVDKSGYLPLWGSVGLWHHATYGKWLKLVPGGPEGYFSSVYTGLNVGEPGNVIVGYVNQPSVDGSAFEILNMRGVTPATFTGSGLNDFNSRSGTTIYNGDTTIQYCAEIDATGATDTFKWSNDNCSTWDATGVAISATRNTLENGVIVRFENVTGHTLGDRWTWTAKPFDPFIVKSIAGSEIFHGYDTGNMTMAGDLTVTGSDITLGAAGVKLTGDGDGAITFLGLGDGFDEDLTINLDDVTNNATFSSSTGINNLVATNMWYTSVRSSDGYGFAIQASGDATPRLALKRDGGFEAGDGTTRDVRLYRSEANTFTIDDTAGGAAATTLTVMSKLNLSAAAGVSYSELNFLDADVNQPFTNIWADTKEFLYLASYSGTAGGGQVIGATDTTGVALRLGGLIGSTDPDDDTPAIQLYATKSNGGNERAALGNDETAVKIQNFNTVLWQIYGDGDSTINGDLTIAGGDILVGAKAMTIGSSAATSMTFTTDGTGNAEFTFPADVIGDADIDWGSGAGQVDLADIPGGTAGASAFDFGGATSLEVPNTAGDVTVDAAGEIALDSTNKQLAVYEGAAEVAIPLRHIFQGSIDLTSAYDVDSDVWIWDLDSTTYPNGIYITAVYVDASVADPTTELDANLMYCDAVAGGAFPGANATLIKAIDTTTGNMSDAAVNTAVAAGKSIYIDLDADPTDANVVYHLKIYYRIPES